MSGGQEGKCYCTSCQKINAEIIAEYVNTEREMGRGPKGDTVPHWYMVMLEGIKNEKIEKEREEKDALLLRGREIYLVEQRGRAIIELIGEGHPVGGLGTILKFKLTNEWENMTEKEKVTYSKKFV